jgi:hypothetical protein
MIVRIVKMTFIPNKVNDFLNVFNLSKDKIRAFKGCQHLKLLQNKKQPNILFTYSYWNSEEDLENYRKSEVFKTTWEQTKVLFLDKPEAWTMVVVEELK